MKYLLLDTAPTSNLELCFVGGNVKDPTGAVIRFKRGIPVGDRYPEDPLDFEVHLDEDWLGLRLPGLLGNTRSLIMLSASALAAVATLNLGNYEAKPFRLINHKGRTHSTDYVIFNPLGTFDIAHPSSDFLRFSKSGKIYNCQRWVLDGAKLVDLPDVVRPAEMPSRYFVSERLVAAVRSPELDNFHFEELTHL